MIVESCKLVMGPKYILNNIRINLVTDTEIRTEHILIIIQHSWKLQEHSDIYLFY